MFNKKIKIKDRIIEIAIFDKVFCKDKNNIIFGFPLISKDSLLKSKKFSKNTKGVWAKISIKNNEVKITTDILGGFRLYYTKKKNMIVISDQYDYLITKQNQKLSINNQEYTFWKKHRYTSGGSTFFKEIKKINPATTLSISGNQINEKSYFKNILRKGNFDKHIKNIENDLDNTFLKIKKTEERKILFFSGGKDSCLLAKYLLKHNIKFNAVYIHLNSNNANEQFSLNRAKQIAKSMDLRFEIITVDENTMKVSMKNEIMKNQLFDRHISLIYYYGCKELKRKYGDNILLVNGQSADNILSFGPSESTLMSYFRRSIMYFPKSLISKIGLFLLKIKERKNFSFPLNENEKLYALFDDYKYTRVIQPDLDKEYKEYFTKYICESVKHLSSFHSKEMLCKILSYCQGSDNQVVINSARHFGLKVIMPFSTSEIIYATIKYKNETLELKKPKYVIDYILLNKFNFNYKKLAKNTGSTIFFDKKIISIFKSSESLTDKELVEQYNLYINKL